MLYVSVHAFLHVCIHVCVHACMNTRVCVCVCIIAHTHVWACGGQGSTSVIFLNCSTSYSESLHWTTALFRLGWWALQIYLALPHRLGVRDVHDHNLFFFFVGAEDPNLGLCVLMASTSFTESSDRLRSALYNPHILHIHHCVFLPSSWNKPKGYRHFVCYWWVPSICNHSENSVGAYVLADYINE